MAMVAPLPPPSPRLTLMCIVLHLQRQCRHRIIRRHSAACAVQNAVGYVSRAVQPPLPSSSDERAANARSLAQPLPT